MTPPTTPSPNTHPDIDAVASARVLRWPFDAGVAAVDATPWLHEEVAHRMAERLSWITTQPQAWADWHHPRGGVQGHERVHAHYPSAQRHVIAPDGAWGPKSAAAQAPRAKIAIKNIANKLTSALKRERSAGAPTRLPASALADGSVQMIWANMLAHQVANVPALLAEWHRVLAVDGFLMFSCFGPDTLRELDAVHRSHGWPAPHHPFTDMHDWGDRLVAAGFAEPVMDMERITLSFDTPERLLAELRGLGRNLHPQRFAGLRGRGWRQAWLQALEGLRNPAEGDRLTLTFEIVYGHAFKAAPRVKNNPTEQRIELSELQTALRQKRRDNNAV